MSKHVAPIRSYRSTRASERPVKAIVLAGGRGTRLAPYTSILPKPLMPIGDRSILELVLGQLASCGIRDVVLSVGHLAHLIEAVLDNGRTHGTDISFVYEEQALGTAGPLRLVEDLDDTFILMNGDVLTTLDFTDIIRHHRRSRNLLTIATHERPSRIDYGVLKLGQNGNRNRVRAYLEKPETTSTVSMGIYVVEPRVLEFVPTSGAFDFPDLVQVLLEHEEPVGAYRFDGLWFDIGRRDDYEEAVAAWHRLLEAKNAVTDDEVSLLNAASFEPTLP